MAGFKINMLSFASIIFVIAVVRSQDGKRLSIFSYKLKFVYLRLLD